MKTNAICDECGEETKCIKIRGAFGRFTYRCELCQKAMDIQQAEWEKEMKERIKVSNKKRWSQWIKKRNEILKK